MRQEMIWVVLPLRQSFPMLFATIQEFNHVGTAKRGRLLGWQIKHRMLKLRCVSSNKRTRRKREIYMAIS
eukprot:8225402-Ditylum_brightwellii.AAC.1